MVLFLRFGLTLKDVSSDPKYGARVGERCIVLNELRAHGVAKDLRSRITDGIDVTPPPGIAGREITFAVPVPKGTTINVIGVRLCRFCPFDRIYYDLTIPDMPQVSPYPAFARAEALSPDEVQCTKNR
jgi:hypothetical protein